MWRLAASWVAARHHRGQKGQTLIIVAFLSVFLITLLGLVVDSVRLYILSAQAERAAEAAALAGALYMPTFFDAAHTAPDGHYAQERACAVLLQNGISNCPAAAGQVGGQVTTVPTNQYEIQVTVTLQTNVFFLAFVSPNLSTTTVSRSAFAQFLPSIELGSRFPYFGDQADNLQNFWAFINGPLEIQEHGDAYTSLLQEGPTDPQLYPDGGSYCIARWNPAWCSTNHQQWPAPITNPDKHPAGFTGSGGTLGYNYQIVIPQGAPQIEVQIYNPAFDPPNNTTTDGLDSACFDPAYNNCAITDNRNEYMQMTYSLYSAPLQFERGTDTFLTSKSYPSLDLASGDLTKHGCSASQAYDPVAGTCVAKPSYVNGWATLPNQAGTGPLMLGPGTYRLVAESGTTGYGRHGYGIKLINAITGQLAPSNSGYGVWGWNDMCVRFNIAATSTFDLGEIPASYAGKTLSFSLFDPGDGGGNISIEILNPSGTAVQLPAWVRTAAGSNGTKILASNSGDEFYNGLWLHLPIPIPANYNPAPGSDWWQIRYTATGTPGDTITISISLSGSPIHLVNEIT